MKGSRLYSPSPLRAPGRFLVFAMVAAGSLCPMTACAQAPAAGKPDSGLECIAGNAGSPQFTVDSWIYPAVERLYSMGFVDGLFLNTRPWTRITVARLLGEADRRLRDAERIREAEPSADAGSSPAAEQGRTIYDALHRELEDYAAASCDRPLRVARFESAYTLVRSISGTSLRDSFHLGSTVINDYGRRYQPGVNHYTGMSGYATAGPFTLYARGEIQRTSSGGGYSAALAQQISQNVDLIPFINPATGVPYNQATLAMGPFSSVARGRVIEAYFSVHVIGHEVSFGKQDEWLGPAQGGSFAYSNNAENIYALHITRVAPLRVPGLSRITGPFRYEFLVGPLKGHVYPNAPWVHLEKISFRPTANLELGFERTAIWGGRGHEPISLHTFLHSFFSVTAPEAAVKNSPADPGARFGSFDFSYRLPFLRNWMTLYADGNVHDDISPIDAPRNASWRPGLYLSHVPGLPRLDARFETAWSDPPIFKSNGGRFMYWETIQRQGYTNNGQIFGDWVGREGKGGQAWLTWHLSGNEWVQVNARNHKTAKDFIATSTTQYGTTINDLGVQVVKRLRPSLELDGSFTFEQYKAPIYLPGRQTVTTTTIQLTWFPGSSIEARR